MREGVGVRDSRFPKEDSRKKSVDYYKSENE